MLKEFLPFVFVAVEAEPPKEYVLDMAEVRVGVFDEVLVEEDNTAFGGFTADNRARAGVRVCSAIVFVSAIVFPSVEK